MRFIPGILLAVCLPALCAGTLAAQHVRGVVYQSETGAPVAGAMVKLVDETGSVRMGVLTGESGGFVLAAGGPGRYSLLVERIGFRDVVTPPIDLATGQTVERDVVAVPQAIVLEGITAEARRRCVSRPGQGVAVATLWSEARKALGAAAYTEQQRQYRFTVNQYSRQLDATSLRVRHEERRSRVGYADGSPFRSLPAERLLNDGFVDIGDTASFYYAPDANVLLSDGFVDAYCFRIAEQRGHPEQLIGLAFEPAERRGPPAVRGTLWLDRSTFELRFIEYGYTRVTFPDGPAHRIGGRVEYEALPNGTWIVRRWWIRMPAVENRSTPWRAAGQRVTPTIVGLLEDGGEVVAVEDAAGGRRVAAALATVSGVVFDSASAVPLAGATVQLEGTEHRAVTDATGRYRMENLPAGEYAISFEHPRLALYDATPLPVAVSVPQGASVVERDLAIPASAAASGWLAKCPADALHPDLTGLLHGRVVDEFTGTPLPGAAVGFTWQQIDTSGAVTITRRVHAGPDGRYVACGLPETGTVTALVSLSGRSAEHAGVAGPGARGLAERDLTLRVTQPQPIVVFVQDFESGRPIADAAITLPGLELTAVTNRQGRVAFDAVPPGSHDIRIEHLAYGSHARALDVGTDAETFEVRVPMRAIALDGVEVTVRSVLEEARRTRGVRRNVVDRAEIARLDRTAEHVGHLAQRIPGLDVSEVYQMGGLRSGLCIRSMRGTTAAGERPCVVIFLDGLPLQGDNSDVLLALPVDAIEAIEFLNPVEAGPRLGTTAGQVGALLVWTRGNGPYARRPR